MKIPTRQISILTVGAVCIVVHGLHAAPGDNEMEIIKGSLRGRQAKYTISEMEASLERLRNSPLSNKSRSQLADLCCDVVEKGVAYRDQPSGFAYGLDPSRRISRSALAVISTHKLTNALPRLIAHFVDQKFSQRETRQDVMQCVDTLGAKKRLVSAVQLRWVALTLTQLPGSRKLNAEERKHLKQLTEEALQKKVDDNGGAHEAQTLLFKAVQFEDPSLAPIIITILQRPDCRWVLKQNGIRMLGELQSEEAIPFLTAFLQQPIPDSADLKDYGEVSAILRSHATMALGKIGNPETVQFLENISKNEREFARVRESAARHALSDITARGERSKTLNHWIDVIEQQPDELHDYWIHVRDDRHYKLSLKDKSALAKMPEDDLDNLYFSFGLYIRNRLLYPRNDKLLESCRQEAMDKHLHWDQAPVVIIKELWKHLKMTHRLKIVK